MSPVFWPCFGVPSAPTEPIASIVITDGVPSEPMAPEFAEAALEFLVSSIFLVLRLPSSDS